MVGNDVSEISSPWFPIHEHSLIELRSGHAGIDSLNDLLGNNDWVDMLWRYNERVVRERMILRCDESEDTGQPSVRHFTFRSKP